MNTIKSNTSKATNPSSKATYYKRLHYRVFFEYINLI